ncbi:hypothetical protein P0O24_04080 [Methanotrichaceae archaeon M04Ac]|uniref:Uncharacterized protein n=1 Tax=Candidatus Methanocrinis alkalitolerans TaxID=3033395 RepID=A0ABT5XDJ5_9EURY|nr:hypothetical protein [Candidatus Methanocrinis alkalitolerans]MDF0592757.1 hypothetical protein [Candidatus Methanocrinis alkalitolerans]
MDSEEIAEKYPTKDLRPIAEKYGVKTLCAKKIGNYSAIPNRPHDADFDYNGMPINNLHQNEKRYPMPRLLEVSFLELATRDL